MHVRVQTWFPFTVDICLNGRQWLAHQMDQAGIAYRQCDNCFVWVEDFVEAQKLLDHQLQSDWPALLQKLLILAHPLQEEIYGSHEGFKLLLERLADRIRNRYRLCQCPKLAAALSAFLAPWNT